MMKIKSFFVGILLLIIVFITVILTTLIYRANERANIKTYIFQMGNSASQRVGELQNINNVSQNDLRNKLIKKYISEYFKVIPDDNYVTNRPVLAQLSTPSVFEQWTNSEAKNIADMSGKKMFRIAKVSDNGIELLNNNADNIDYKKQITAEHIYYIVRYDTYTWTQSNIMKSEPLIEQGVMYLEILFEPGLREHDKYGDKINIRKYLESGQNPVGLFRFRVTAIGSKDIQ